MFLKTAVFTKVVIEEKTNIVFEVDVCLETDCGFLFNEFLQIDEFNYSYILKSSDILKVKDETENVMDDVKERFLFYVKNRLEIEMSKVECINLQSL